MSSQSSPPDDTGPEPVGTSAAAPSPVISANKRPEDVTRLLYGGETHSEWFPANRRANRFFVINLSSVIGHLDLDHTKAQPYFSRAQQAIADQTNWRTQFRFDYQSSHTQIFPGKQRLPKLFGHAATIIVAMEFAAAEIEPGYNVYDYLRILPAQYFVDRFDAAVRERLMQSHNAMNVADRAAKFGAERAERSFDEVCLWKIDQEHSTDLLQQITSGYCVTKYTAEKLAEFINEHYPEPKPFEIRSAGAEAVSNDLGTKNAAPALRVPRTRPTSELPLCF
jgi:hypothetical protein